MNRPRRITGIALCLTIAMSAHALPKKKPKAAARPVPKQMHLESAYFAGHIVKFHSLPSKDGHAVVVGPWNLGPKISPKPNDRRPNLYFVSPGTQHRVAGHPEFDHNEILSAVPDGESDFDVFWVVVLDPTVKGDFTSEQQIILATQQAFEPPEDFDFQQIPSAGFLKAFLKIGDMDALKKLDRPDKDLPRVAIVRAGFSVRAVAEEQEETTDSAAEKAPSE